MDNRIIFNRRNLRELWLVTDYRIDALVKDGILPKPIKEKGRFPYWTPSQVRTAERRMNEKKNPVEATVAADIRTRPLSKKDCNEIRAYHGLPLIP